MRSVYHAPVRAVLVLALCGDHFLQGQREFDLARFIDANAHWLFLAHTALGTSYLFGEPRDFTKALEHMQHGEALAPDEPNAHMFVGDAYRAQRNLDKARDEYLGRRSTSSTSWWRRWTAWESPTRKPTRSQHSPTSWSSLLTLVTARPRSRR